MLNRLSFGTKLIFMGAMTSILIISIGIISYVLENKVDQNYRFVIEKTVPKMELVNQMLLNYRNLRISLGALVIPGLSKTAAETALETITSEIKTYDEIEKAYSDLGFINGQKELFEKNHSAWEEFKTIAQEIPELYKKGTPDATQKIYSLSLNESVEKAAIYKASVDSLIAFHKKILADKAKAAEDEASTATTSIWIFITVSVLLGLGVSLTISISASRELKAIAGGLIGNVSEVSGTVSDLTSSASALSAAANTQASSIQETSASVEEIRSMVERNTENTIESARLSGLSKQHANTGQSSVKDMIDAMNDITESNKLIEEEIENSNRRLTEIVGIIAEIENKTAVINEIVFQTKLLSFNASVEAARAGDNGKGFAVVAQEVGNLANMSGRAAKEITALLAQSTQKVNSIVQETTTRVRQLME